MKVLRVMQNGNLRTSSRIQTGTDCYPRKKRKQKYDMENRTVLEEVEVSKIVLPQGHESETSLGIEGLKRLENDYPWTELFDSVEKNGFQAIWNDWPSHGDNGFFKPQPYMVNKHGDRYLLTNGQRRSTVAHMLGLEKVPAYVVYNDYPVREREFYEKYMKEYEDYLQDTGKGMFQMLMFPHGLVMNQRRDLSCTIFHSTKWDHAYWQGKKFLDIAHNGGFFPLEAKRLGAARSVGFEIDDWMYGKSKETAEVLELDVELYKSDFWNFNASEGEYDIVMCNQAIYHFGEGDRANEALARLASWTSNDLVMFTFLEGEDEYQSDNRFGYRPTRQVMIDDLHNLGFERVRIYHEIPGAKYTVVASKQPNIYPWVWETHDMVYTDYTEKLVAVSATEFSVKRTDNYGNKSLITVQRNGS